MVTDSTLVDNEECCTGSGGGIWSDGTLTVLHSRLTHSGSDGTGGIDARGGTVIAHSSIVDTGSNPPSAEVGGLSNHGIMYITASTIIRNFAGAMTNVGLLTIHNSTITENRFFAGAGGILNEGGLLTILNSTIVRNTAVVASPKGDSAGIWNRPTATEPPSVGIVTLQNTILAQNSLGSLPGDSGAGPDCKGPIISLGHNLIGDPTNCTITLHTSDRTGDPGIGAFSTGDGAPGHGHVPLLPGSPAIDMGNDAVCPRRDQLGQRRVNIPRVGSSRCDIGAIEFQRRDNQQRDEALATAAPVTP